MGIQQYTEADSPLCDTAELWHMTLLNCILLVFFVLSGNKEMEKAKKIFFFFFFSPSHTSFLISTNMHTTRPVEPRAGLSVAYKRLLENSLLPFFFLGVFAMCMWVCACPEKKRGRNGSVPVCIQYVSELYGKINRLVWCVSAVSVYYTAQTKAWGVLLHEEWD